MPSETAKASLGYVTSYGAAKRGGYQGTYEEWCALMAEVADHLEENIQLNEDSQAAKAAAILAEQEAETAAQNAEAWATGGSGGTPGETNNALYYANRANFEQMSAAQAASAASGHAARAGGYSEDAEAWAKGTRGGEDVESGDDAYENNAKFFSEQSAGSATDAAGSAESAEAWATGGSGGTAGESNNAKYYSEQAAASAATAAAMGTNFAPDFSASTAYTAGQYVMKDGTLYRFTADHAAGAWSGSDAVAEKIAPEVSELKTQLNYDIGNITFTDDYFLNSSNTPTYSTSFAYTDYIPIVYGLLLKVKVGNDNSRHCFYDKDKRFISGTAENDYGKGNALTPVTIPDNAAYIRISTYKNQKNELEVLPLPVLDSFEKVKENAEKSNTNITKNAENITKLEDYEFSLTDDIYIDASGEEHSSTNYSSTDFIMLMNTIKVLTKVGDDNSRHAFYNKDKIFISAESDFAHFGELTDLIIPQNAVYIRISVYKNQKSELQVKYNLNKELKYDALTKNNRYYFGTIGITDSKYITRSAGNEGNVATDSASCATRYIEVLPNSVVELSSLYLAGNRTVALYNKDKTVIKCLTSESSTETELIAEIPNNCRYIRATGRVGVAPVFKYLTPTTAAEMDGYTKRNGYNTLYNQAASVPVLSIVDDDTVSANAVRTWKEHCDDFGIKINFACLAQMLTEASGLTNALLEFEREGFPVLVHGYSQGEFYKPAPDRDIVAAEADLVHGIHDIQAAGFIDFKAAWVTPFGRCDDELKALAIKWGFESLIRYDYNEKIEDPAQLNPMHRYEIHRYAFADESKLSTIKSLIDMAVECNGWVLVGFHSGHASNNTPEFVAAFEDMVDYAREHGVQIRTVNEELRRRMPIYNNYEKY